LWLSQAGRGKEKRKGKKKKGKGKKENGFREVEDAPLTDPGNRGSRARRKREKKKTLGSEKANRRCGSPSRGETKKKKDEKVRGVTASSSREASSQGRRAATEGIPEERKKKTGLGGSTCGPSCGINAVGPRPSTSEEREGREERRNGREKDGTGSSRFV